MVAWHATLFDDKTAQFYSEEEGFARISIKGAKRMRIAQGIEMLELELGGRTLCPSLLVDENGWVLVDTGLPGNAPALLELAKQAGVGELPLRSILLTHQDIDHVGGLPAFLAAEGDTPSVYAHADDEGAINGTQPMIKVSQERMAGLMQQMTETTRSEFERTFLHPSRPNVTDRLVDGETLPIAGGVTVIHTPGHTPGHVSLYHKPSKTLIAGDAMMVVNGELTGPNPPFTPDYPKAIQSLGKLAALDIDTVICYHGGMLTGDIPARIAALANNA
jgi:glyoxylase-like metal-dependent hydrolase (beta-lactamase superfamily II)